MIPGDWPVIATQPGWLGTAALLISIPFILFGVYTAIVCYIFLPTITRVFEESPIFTPPEEAP